MRDFLLGCLTHGLFDRDLRRAIPCQTRGFISVESLQILLRIELDAWLRVSRQRSAHPLIGARARKKPEHHKRENGDRGAYRDSAHQNEPSGDVGGVMFCRLKMSFGHLQPYAAQGKSCEPTPNQAWSQTCQSKQR